VGGGALSCALSLPDSFGQIFVGETFAAYLGVINPEPADGGYPGGRGLPIKWLTVSAKLITPTKRYDLITKQVDDDSNSNASSSNQAPPKPQAAPVDVPAGGAIDMILSKSLDSVGTHTLRVSVLYGNQQVLRKFYRFSVDLPLQIKSQVGRLDDRSVVVQADVKNLTEDGLTITDAQFEAAPGLKAVKLGDGGGEGGAPGEGAPGEGAPAGADMFDKSNRLDPKSTTRFL
jgi:hypothetical protein